MQPSPPHACPVAPLSAGPSHWQSNPFSSLPYVPTILTPSLSPFLKAPEMWYQEECKRLDIQNMALLKTIESLANECTAMQAKLLECDNPDPDRIHGKKRKKRSRRVAVAIPRHFQCSKCAKAYG